MDISSLSSGPRDKMVNAGRSILFVSCDLVGRPAMALWPITPHRGFTKYEK